MTELSITRPSTIEQFLATLGVKLPLDKALERFADKIPYGNQPDDASEPSGGDRK